MEKKKLLIGSLIGLSMLTLVGCGKSASLSSYQDNMAAFSENIAAIDEKMNTIDAASENAVEELLECLNSMNEEFTNLAELEVPEQFASVETLADEAGSYMSEAVDLYKQVFSTTPYDEYSSVLADESYKRAMKRVQYIGEILQGRVPEGEDITVYTEGEEPAATDTDDNTNGEEPEVPVEDLLEE